MEATTNLTVPTSGVWQLDTAHSTIGFVARHLMVTKVHGRFERFTSEVDLGDELGKLTAKATIEAASISTGDERRDGHLRGADFFDVEKYPTIGFVTTAVTELGGNRFQLTGDLTIRDVTNPVELDVEYLGINKSPWGQTVASFVAKGEIDRELWGLTWNQALESGGVLVSKKIQIDIEAEAVLQSDVELKASAASGKAATTA